MPRHRRGWRAPLFALGALALGASTAQAKDACPPAPDLRWGVTAERPVPPDSFVQGFVIDGARWWLSSGGYGRSYVEELQTNGQATQRQAIDRALFAEGLALRNDELWLLSWQAGNGLRLDKNTLRIRGRFDYAGQGWGLAWSAERQQFLRSDGSDKLFWHSPRDFERVGAITVRLNGRTVSRLNELELVGTHVFANVWLSDQILKIDSATGCVNGVIDLRKLWPAAQRPRQADVLNGIAFEAQTERLWVTGKRWGRAFALELEN